jgi:Tfp pilus assembly protein FimT
MVVMGIISSLLVFSLPVFRDLAVFSGGKNQVGDMARLIDDLKKRAVEQNAEMVLHMDTASNMVWVTGEHMDAAQIEAAKENGVQLTGDIRVSGVEYPEMTLTSFLEFQIRFSRHGYSDAAHIHIMENQKNITLKIAPFLSRVQIADGHVHFEDCL